MENMYLFYCALFFNKTKLFKNYYYLNNVQDIKTLKTYELNLNVKIY